MTNTKHHQRRAEILLLAVAAVWGFAFVFQKEAAQDIGPFSFNTARLLLGITTLLPILIVQRGTLCSRSLWRSGLLLGVLLYGGTAFQQIGMSTTTAGKAGFITGLYTVLVPLLAYVLFREVQSWNAYVGAVVATLGLYLLSVGEDLSITTGDIWVFFCAIAFALHVIFVGRLVTHQDPLALSIIQYLVAMVLNGISALLGESISLLAFATHWKGILYMGCISLGFGYTAQLFGQRATTATRAGLIISLESVFALISGVYVLQERLTQQQIVGCIAMLGGILFAQLTFSKRRKLPL